jgi:DNA-binding LacI/PurR family transcriptional regulator
MEKKTTIKDIARIAGVDPSTVSRALNGSSRVSTGTRERIMEIASKLDFEFNAAGRTLSRGKSGNIAVLCSTQISSFSSSQYVSMLFSAIRLELEKRRLDAFILEGHDLHSGESTIKRLVGQHKADGFIIADPDISPDEYHFIRKHDIPAVQLHACPEFYPLDQLNYVMTDHYAGGGLAAEHLVEIGRTNILNFTARNPLTYEFAQRLEGFRDALSAAGITLHDEDILNSDCSYQAGYQLVHAYFDRIKKADAIFAQADITAFGCHSALRELGVRIPEDIALIGYDDTPLCTLPIPEISSIHQPLEKASSAACDWIAQAVSSDGPRPVLQKKITPRLVERGSTQSAIHREIR